MSEKKIDIKLVRSIANILKRENLSEIEIQMKDFSLRIANNFSGKSGNFLHDLPFMPTVSRVGLHEEKQEFQEKRTLIPEPGQLKKVLSPMVGIAYAAPSPEAKAFIEEGQFIEKGQTLLIIEAMKTMNHIPSPQSGKVAKIHFQNGQPVEFEEHLVTLNEHAE